MQLSSLVCNLPEITVSEEWKSVQVTDIVTESARVKKGSLFVALKGMCDDGNRYAAEAERLGACAILSDERIQTRLPFVLVSDARKALSLIASEFYGNPSRQLKLVGVTGTNGKTTVTYMLSSIFRAARKKAGVIGTLGAAWGNQRRETSLTTPDPLAFEQILSEMVKDGVTYCFAEISAHALYWEKEYGCRYAAAIFTNLTRDHLDFFGSMENYALAKQKLFFERDCGRYIVNADDEYGRKLLKKNLPVLTYALDSPSDCFAITLQEGVDGSRVLFNLEDDLCEANLRLLGEHNVLNALAAASYAHSEGISLENIADGLSALNGVEGRLDKVGEVNGAAIFIDFAHTPDGLQKCLSALRRVCKNKLYCLFGCGGNRDSGKRPVMGDTASLYADGVILTSDNPRYEDPLDIIREIEKGIPESRPHVAIEDRAEAIAYAVSLLKKGDILLIAGKGAEKYQECMGIKREYSDYNVIKRILS